MIYLLASILSSALIYVIFKVSKKYKVRLHVLITLNYLVAALLGFIFLLQLDVNVFLKNNSWIPSGIALAVFFILMFFLLGISSQNAGISVTTLANKLSVVFPVMFSLFYFREEILWLKYIGLVLAFAAILLTVYKKDIQKTKVALIVLPLAIFFGSGIIDSLIKYIQATQITAGQVTAFSTFVFFTAFVLGVLVVLFKKNRQNKKVLVPTLFWGSLLGIANFGSLFFFINALNHSKLESSLVFALNNMSIVALSAILGAFVFHEKLNKFNLTGILLAIISLYILLK